MSESSPARRTRRIGVDLTHMQMGGVNGGAKPAAMSLVKLIAACGRFDITVFIMASYAEKLCFTVEDNIEILRVDDRFVHSEGRMAGNKEPWSLARAVGCDLLFAPFGDPYLWEQDLPTVSQRYDLQHLDHPEFFESGELRHRERSDRRLKELSTHVITSSEFSRGKFISKLGLESDRISVIPLPLPAIPNQEESPTNSSLLVDLGLSDQAYLYYPANFWPHKNHLRLLDAFAAATRHADSDAPHLVLTGATLDAAEAIQSHAETCGVADRVHTLGFVSDQQRDAIWRGCEALIFPSLYEGFGIPIQEAMLYGKPIAASNACSIPEVGGLAATYFDGRDIQDMTRAIRTILEDPETRAGQEFHREGQLQRFQPDTIATQYIELFDHIINESNLGTHPGPAGIDVVITGCGAAVKLENTLTSLESQSTKPRSITLVSSTSVDHATLERTGLIAPLTVVTAMDEEVQAVGLDTALRESDGDAIILLQAGDALLTNSLRHAGLAVASFPTAWLIHGLAFGVSQSGNVVLESPIEAIECSDKSTRHFATRSSSLISRHALGSTSPIGTTRFAFEDVIAQVPIGGDSLLIPVHLSQTPLETDHSIVDLKTLNAVLHSREMPDPGVWLIDQCEAMVISDEIAAGGMPTLYRVADKLLWKAPFLYGLADIPFDDSSLQALKSKWRNARHGSDISMMTNRLQSVLASNPRETVLRGLVGPPIQKRASEMFTDSRVWKKIWCSSDFQQALSIAQVDDLQPEWRAILSVENSREFAVQAFELATGSTPCASEVALFTDVDDDAARMRAIRDIIVEALSRDSTEIQRVSFVDAPIQLGMTPEAVLRPFGSDVSLTATEWLQQLDSTRQRFSEVSKSSVDESNAKARCKPLENPNVTILCSLYDGDEYIDQYLANMTEQEDFGDCELVIVDACSPGRECDVIERYMSDYPNISYSRAESRIGIYEAWNIAIRKSTGRFITNANLDDARHPESIVRMRDALDAHTEVDVVYSDFLYTFLPHLPWREVEAVGFRSHLPPPTIHNMLDFNSPHCAPMWRRSLHERYGYFDESFRSAGDWEFWLRGIRSGLTLHKIDSPMIAYFHNARGMSTQLNTPGLRESQAIRRAYRDLLIGPNAALDPIASIANTYSNSPDNDGR
jgi:glycosyltransferase involved in cell wall biosynthesis